MWAARRCCFAAWRLGDSGRGAAQAVQRFQRRAFGLAVTIVGESARRRGHLRESSCGAAPRRRLRPWTGNRRCALDDYLEPFHRLGAGASPAFSVDPDSILALNLSAGGLPLFGRARGGSDDADRLCAALIQLPVEKKRRARRVMAGLLGHTAREVRSEAEDIPSAPSD